jgi:uncharacterized lipoprotein YmbA
MNKRFGWGWSWAIVGAVTALSACSTSPPMRYYTLSASAPGELSSAAGALTPLHVGRISIPGDIDRTQLVNRIDENRLRVADMDRWAAPLDEMIRRTLAADLAARLPAGTVTDLDDARPGQKRRVLSLDIQEFHGDATCAVTLRAAWILTEPDAQSGGARGTEVVKIPSSGACPDTLAIGMSQALAQLSDRIASNVERGAKLGAP